MALVEWVAPEAFVDSTELGARTDWEVAGGPMATVTRSIFGIEGEKWFNMGGADTNLIRTNFFSESNEVEVSVTLNLDSAAPLSVMGGAADELKNILKIESLTPENGLQGPVFQYSRQEGIPGNQTHVKMSGGDVNYSAPIANFEVIPGGVYYFTLRLRDSVAGNDGMAEFWVNNILLYSNYTLNFLSLEDDFNNFRVTCGNFNGNTTFMRNLTAHDAWTTAKENPPQYKTVVEAIELNEIDVASYNLTGSALTVSEALVDYDDTTFIETDVANSIAKLGFANIPAALATNQVLDVGTRSKFARKATGFSTPTVTITDASSGVPHNEITKSINVVGTARQRLDLTAAIPANVTLDQIVVQIDSGS